MAERNDDSVERDSPKPPHWLEYRSPRQERQDSPEPSMGSQIGMGFVAWLGTVTIPFIILFYIGMAGLGGRIFIYSVMMVALGGLITLCVHVRIRYHWRGFIPGVLLGMGLTCLLPLGILTILCGSPF
jgi:hypothetical protein